MKWKNLILEIENKVATLYINRPEALNALNTELLQQLSQALDTIKDDSEIKVLIITGPGDKAFISGADIEYMVDMTTEEAQEFSALGQNLFLKLDQIYF